MKLRELLVKLNERMEDIKGVKFESSNQYCSEIMNRADEIISNTELEKLLVYSTRSVRLIEEEDIGVFGSVGNKLFEEFCFVTTDKRIKYGYKGKFDSVEFKLDNELPVELLDYELKDLQKYFDKELLQINIDWTTREIKRLKEEITELERNKAQYEKELIELEQESL